MYPHASGDRVKVMWSLEEDSDVYINRLTEWEDARREYRAHQTELSTVPLRPFEERLAAAESDVEDAFTETLTIEQAERLQSRLFKAITEAKVAAGRFNP